LSGDEEGYINVESKYVGFATANNFRVLAGQSREFKNGFERPLNQSVDVGE
jgi:hypothetical protein